MRFHVGPWVYTLRIATVGEPGAENLLDDDGNPLLGRADYCSREILIAADISLDRRLDVLLHELKHCWLFHLPKPRNEEEMCNFAATFTAQAMRDLEEQGGVASLMRIQPQHMVAKPVDEEIPFGLPSDPLDPAVVPDTYVYETQTLATPHGARAECAECGLVVAGKQIVYSVPKWNQSLHGMSCVGRLFCPHCEVVQEWDEGVNGAGLPNGSVADGPRRLRGREAEAFLRAHPEATGMIVA